MVLCKIRIKPSLDNQLSFKELADEGEDKEREDCAPDKGVDDHYGPPDDAAGRRAKSSGDNITRLAKEALEDNEQHKMHHAKRHVGEQERFHMYFPFISYSFFRHVLRFHGSGH